MKIEDADAVWTPTTIGDGDIPNRGAVRVERHGSGWQRAYGERWMPAVGHTPHLLHTANDKLLGMFILFNTLTVLTTYAT
jgi:hypothetical protein